MANNTIEYAPGCGGSTVDIQNAATAALYIYTPYQPDSNVLANTNPIGSTSGPGPAIIVTIVVLPMAIATSGGTLIVGLGQVLIQTFL